MSVRLHTWVFGASIAVLAVLLVAAAHRRGVPDPQPAPATPRAAPAEEHDHDSDERDRASSHDFKLKDLEGRLVDFAEARKGKVVLLKFGALWCGWCNKQTEEFVKLQAKLDPAQAVIFEVSVKTDLPEEQVLAKAKEHGLRHSIVRDADGKVSEQYGVEFLPSLFLIDSGGAIVWQGAYTTADKLEKLIQDALTKG